MSIKNLSSRLKWDSFTYFIGRIVPAALSFCSISVFIKLLGEKIYGEYTLIMSLSLIVSNISGGWLTQSILRYQSSFHLKHAYKKYIYTLNFSMLQSLVVAVFTVGILSYINFRDLGKFIASIFIVASQVIYMVVFSQQQALLSSRKILIAETLRAIIGFLLPLGAVFTLKNHSYFLLLLGVIAGNILGFIIIDTNFSFLSRSWNATKQYSSRLSNYLWAYGWPMAAWAGTATSLNVVDRYIIGWLVDVQSVGIYSAVYDVIYKSLNLLLTPILLAAHPMIVREWNTGNITEAKKLIRQALLFQICISFIFILVISNNNITLIKFVLGRNDEVASMLIFPVALGAVIWQTTMLLHKPLELEKKTRLLLLFCIISLITNIILNIILIPLFGYVAASYTTLASAVLYIVLILLYKSIVQVLKRSAQSKKIHT